MYMERFLTDHINTITLIGVIISGLTLLLAYKIQKLIAKNHLVTKQIDLVCQLIETLNQSKIKIGFATRREKGSYGYTGDGISFNIFELGSYDKIDSKGLNFQYNDEIILFHHKSNQLLDIKKFIDSPLTPTVIADQLFLFYNSSCLYIDTERPEVDFEKFVIVETGIWEEKVLFNKNLKENLIEADAVAFLSWKNLKEYSKYLKIIIGEWLIKNGIDENNMREDFKNPR